MTPEAERIAEAGQILKMYGTAAPAFVATRIGALSLTGDQAGIERWRQIAGRLDALIRAEGMQ